MKSLQAQEQDEYDDTYDCTDIISTINDPYDSDSDSTSTSTSNNQNNIKNNENTRDKLEQILVDLYKTDPSIFHPSQRKSTFRQNILNQIQLTNEQFEGWCVMLNRNVSFCI